jgi:hypothetical protein
MSDDAETYNSQLASRQIEINEWSYNNKMDTLFVFQILFISLLIVSILMLFSYQGVIGRGFVWYTFGILILLDILIIVNRAMYTDRIRDKKHWDRVSFPDDNKLPSPLGRNTEYINQIEDAYGSPSGSKKCCTKSCTC